MKKIINNYILYLNCFEYNFEKEWIYLNNIYKLIKITSYMLSYFSSLFSLDLSNLNNNNFNYINEMFYSCSKLSSFNLSNFNINNVNNMSYIIEE